MNNKKLYFEQKLNTKRRTQTLEDSLRPFTWGAKMRELDYGKTTLSVRADTMEEIKEDKIRVNSL
jgi:hypothetical protein